MNNLTDVHITGLGGVNAGTLVFNTTLSSMQFYDGSLWRIISGGGTTLLSGSGVPSSGLGVNGNYYIDSSGGDIYLKTAGSWSVLVAISGLPLSGGTMTGQIVFQAGIGSPQIVWLDSDAWDIDIRDLGDPGAVNFNIANNGNRILVAQRDGNVNVYAGRLQIQGTNVLNTQLSTITGPSGGGTIDSQARTAITSILSLLSHHGLMA